MIRVPTGKIANDVPTILRSLDVLLVPSREEPFGRTIAEAMVVGTPVIATSVGGPAELIEDRVTGILAPPDAPAQWAQAIDALLANPDAAQAMARRARDVAIGRFDHRLHASRMLEIFERASW